MEYESRSVLLAKACLGREVTVVIDRPLGSLHAASALPYPVNCGFVPGTEAEDREELDAYVLGPTDPLKEFTGDCVAIIHRRTDDDDTLVVVPKGLSISDETIRKETHFQEQHFESEIIRP